MSLSSLTCNYENYYISWDEFVNCCHQFVEISNKLQDGWVFYQCDELKAIGESYLVKKIVKVYDYEILCKKGQVDDDDDGVTNNPVAVSWEYHILYSPSYGVPSLYFNAWKRDGNILSVDEINTCTGDFNTNNKICIISQQEHPILHRPFYCVHPCDSIKVIRLYKSIMHNQLSVKYNCADISKKQNVNPLIPWLSTIAAAVGIDLPYQYGLNSLNKTIDP